MESHEKKLKHLKDNLEKAKSLKYKAEARLEQLNKQQEELINELKTLNVKPEELDDEIRNLKDEINRLFKEADDLLPKDIIEGV